MSLSNLLIIFSSSFMALFPVVNPLGNGFVVNGFFTDLDAMPINDKEHLM